MINKIGAKSGQTNVDITMPPSSNIGARTMPRVTIITKFCIWVTSLVMRVIRVAGFNPAASRVDKAICNISDRNDSPIFNEA